MSQCVLLTVLVFILCLGSVAAQDAWRSALYPEDWAPGLRDEAGRMLHDFSYAGYRSGEAPVPERVTGVWVDVTAPPYSADATGVAGATDAIQRAIDDVGRQGGGTVFLPPGVYRITFPTPEANAALRVAHSGVVLQGAGPDKTFLFLDETVSRGKALLLVAPAAGMDWYRVIPGTEQLLREDVTAPGSVLPLAEPPRFAVGDWVAVTHDTTEAWVREHNMAGIWPPGRVPGQLFFRRVTAVDSEHRTITIDAPTRYDLKTRDRARVYAVAAPIEEVGIVGLAIGMRENAKAGWGTADHAVPATGAYDVHGSRAVVLRGVVNGWIQDVATYRPPENRQFHIHSIGIEVVHSRHVTVRRVSVANPQYLGGGGNGYPLVIAGQDSLFHHVRAMTGRHPITITGGQTNGNVVLGGYISSPVSLASDFHAFLSVANLIDNLTIDGDRFEAGDRSHASGTGGLSHGASTSQSVFWNINGLAYKDDGSRGDVIVWTEQSGWGYVIGTRGPAHRVGAGTGIRMRPVDFVEGEGRGETLEPRSLYIDQLRRRLEREGKAALWPVLAADLAWDDT